MEEMSSEKPLDQEKTQLLGRVAATQNEPTTCESFKFWLRPDHHLRRFDVIAVDQPLFDAKGNPVGKSKTFGVVTEIDHMNNTEHMIDNFVGNDFGELEGEPNTKRVGMNMAKAQVLENSAGSDMPVQSDANVWIASSAEVQMAFGMNRMKEKELKQNRVVCFPGGLIRGSGGDTVPAIFDLDFVLGPEGAHVNISGMSGLAAKTSYAIFLITSILQTLEKSKYSWNEKSLGINDVAVILMNVKYHDLLGIDLPSDEPLSSEDKVRWSALGLDPKPFKNVVYLLPNKKNPVGKAIPNSYKAPEQNKVYAYEFRDCVDNLDGLLTGVNDPNGTFARMRSHILDGFTYKGEPRDEWKNVRTWDDLMNRSPLTQMVQKGGRRNEDAEGSIHPYAWERFKDEIRKLTKGNNTGVHVEKMPVGGTTVRKELADMEGGKTYVVDMAKLGESEQALVFSDVVKTVYKVMSQDLISDLGKPPVNRPKKVIIFFDELNKYAPAEGKGALAETIREIAQRGRTLGVILISAQQLASHVDDKVLATISNRVVGRTDSTESRKPNYGCLGDAKNYVETLQQGEMVLVHPPYRKPMKVIFPKPAYHQYK